jgi:hypothetical protein
MVIKRLRALVLTVVAALVVALAVLCLPRTATSAAVSTRLVLLYSFNTDSTSAIADSSTNSLTGTLTNADASSAFVPGAPGKGKGLRLVAPQRQYVSVPEDNVLDVGQYTLAAWVRYTGNATPDTHDRWEVMEKAGAYWLNIRTNGHVRAGGFYGGCVASQYWKYLDSVGTVAPNVWTHVAATYDGSQLTIYIDGSPSGSATISGQTCSNDEPLAVGAKNAPASGLLEAFWDGRLDDVRIYGKAFSAARISRLAS